MYWTEPKTRIYIVTQLLVTAGSLRLSHIKLFVAASLESAALHMFQFHAVACNLLINVTCLLTVLHGDFSLLIAETVTSYFTSITSECYFNKSNAIKVLRTLKLYLNIFKVTLKIKDKHNALHNVSI